MSDQNFLLRPASGEDIPAIGRIARLAWEASFLETFLTREQLEFDLAREYAPASLARQMAEGHDFVMLEGENHRAIGFAAYVIHEDGELFLHKLYLDPSVKGQGLGRVMIIALEEKARMRACDRIALLVNRHNPAVGFYEKLGFRIEGEVDTPIGGSFWRRDFRMVKVLFAS